MRNKQIIKLLGRKWSKNNTWDNINVLQAQGNAGKVVCKLGTVFLDSKNKEGVHDRL